MAQLTSQLTHLTTPPPFVPVTNKSTLYGATDSGLAGQMGGLINPMSSQICSLLERYKQLESREMQLVAQLKDENPRSLIGQQIGRQLQFVLVQKIRELNTLVGEHQLQSIELEVPVVASAVLPNLPFGSTLEITEQPQGNVVANKYLEPSVSLRVDAKFLSLAKDSRLQVSASLGLALSDKLLLRTLDGKQDILQGHVCVLVGSDGLVSFNKLKIMEVSSKYQHQAFCIQFQLEELKASVARPIGAPIKSIPLHVQSRVNKRKKSLTSSTDGMDLRSSNDSLYKKVKVEENSQFKAIKPEIMMEDNIIKNNGKNNLRSSGGVATRSSLRNSLGGIYPKVGDGNSSIQTNTDVA